MKRLLVVVIVTILHPSISTAEGLLFSGPPCFSINHSVQSVVKGDFNEDGYVDLALGSSGDELTILIGTGNGSFSDGAQYSGLSGTNSIATGDFNEDGHIDLTTSGSILLGAGDGTFIRGVDHMAGRSSVIVDDFNKDGHSDLAVVYTFQRKIPVLLGNGDGSFSSPQDIELFSAPLSLASADFNGDSIPDIVTTTDNTASPDSIYILLGDGDGTFTSLTIYPVGSQPKSVFAEDFDEDGDIDLAVANNLSATITILHGLGNGYFDQTAEYFSGANPQAIDAADFDDDGNIDLAYRNYDYNVGILRGFGDGTFTYFKTIRAGRSTTSISNADYNGDGFIDIAVGNDYYGSLTMLIGEGDCTFAAATHLIADHGDGPRAVAIGDVNGDGNDDLLAANESRNTSIFLGNGDGSFAEPSYGASGYHPFRIIVEDLNADGHLDYAVANKGDYPDTGSVYVSLGHGDGTFSYGVHYRTGFGPTSVSTGDFDEDGIVDLAVTNHASNNILILIGTGGGAFTPSISYSVGRWPWSSVSDDFNEDGHLDIAVTNYRDNTISILIGGGDGAFSILSPLITGTEPADIVSGDFNDDGHLDFAVPNYQSENVSIHLGCGDGTFEPTKYCTVGPLPRSVANADFNGDGIQDLAVNDYRTQNITSLLGVGDGTFILENDYFAGGSYTTATGDFDGNGHIDIATSAITVLMNCSGNTTSTLLEYYDYYVKEDRIEVLWTLSTKKAIKNYMIYRRTEGRSEFLPLDVNIVSVTDLSFIFTDVTCELGQTYTYRLDYVNGIGEINTLFVTEQISILLPELKLYQNFPNPFNPSTTIHFFMPEKSHAVVEIYDVSGRQVIKLVDSELAAGTHYIEWDGNNEKGNSVSTGVYLIRLNTCKNILSKKMLLLR
jgi:hypothetical protein